MSDGESLLARPFAGLVQELTAPDNVAAAALGLIGPGGHPVGLLAGLEPVVARMQRLMQAEQHASFERAGAMWLIAEHDARQPVSDLVDRAASDEERRHLAVTAAQGAESARYPARIIAIARDLLSGLLTESMDDVRIQQEFVAALGALDRPHIAVLAAMTTRDGETIHGHVMNQEDVLSRVPSAGPAFARLIATLEREGAVQDRTGSFPGGANYSGGVWRPTDFGQEILLQLYRAGLNPDADA